MSQPRRRMAHRPFSPATIGAALLLAAATMTSVGAQSADVIPLRADRGSAERPFQGAEAEASRARAASGPDTSWVPPDDAEPAQESQRQRQRPQPNPSGPSSFGIAGFADVGFVAFSAEESIEAVYESALGLIWGGGVRVSHQSGWFARVSASRFSADGERVFVSSGQVFPLGIPSTLTVTPVDFTGGWRFVPRPRGPQRGKPVPARVTRSSGRRLIPYVGGGAGIVRVTERAEFADQDDDVNEQHTSWHVLGGVDVPLSRLFGFGAEAGWRWVPDALLGTGVADAFGESDLDHLFVLARFTIGR